MLPEPVTPTTPRPATRTVFTQGWRDLAFLHWAVDPAVVATHLPPGTRPDTLGGVTHIGLIPFRMRRIGLLGLPYLGSFAEINVRLYSVDSHGRRGVVFASLEADRLLPVLAARWVARLPYVYADADHRGRRPPPVHLEPSVAGPTGSAQHDRRPGWSTWTSPSPRPPGCPCGVRRTACCSPPASTSGSGR